MARKEKLGEEEVKLLIYMRRKEVGTTSLGRLFDIDPDTAQRYWKKYGDIEIEEEDIPDLIWNLGSSD